MGEATVVSPLVHVVAGGCAGAAADFAMHPVDTLKTQLQASYHQSSSKSLSRVRRSLQRHGVRRLYAGAVPMLSGSFPSTGVYFATYELLKQAGERRVGAEHAALVPVVHLGSALVAEVFAAAIWVPFDVIKQRMQLNGSSYYRSVPHAFSRIVRREGVRGVYTGFGATLLRDCPFVGLQFVLYEQFRVQTQRLLHRDELSVPSNLAIGAVAGAIAAVVTTPFDVVKTRLQTQESGVVVPKASSRSPEAPERRQRHTSPRSKQAGKVQAAAAEGASRAKASSAAAMSRATAPAASPPLVVGPAIATFASDSHRASSAPRAQAVRYGGVMDALRRIAAEEGAAAFFKGVLPRAIWVTPGSAIMFAVYDKVKALMEPGDTVH